VRFTPWLLFSPSPVPGANPPPKRVLRSSPSRSFSVIATASAYVETDEIRFCSFSFFLGAPFVPPPLPRYPMITIPVIWFLFFHRLPRTIALSFLGLVLRVPIRRSWDELFFRQSFFPVFAGDRGPKAHEHALVFFPPFLP